MKYKVTATYVFEVEADKPEWAQELVDVNCLSMHIHNLEGKEIYPSYDVEAVEQCVHPTPPTARSISVTCPKCGTFIGVDFANTAGG